MLRPDELKARARSQERLETLKEALTSTRQNPTLRERFKKGLLWTAGRFGSIHDIILHLIFSNKRCAVNFFMTYTPQWAKYLDFENLTFEPNDFYTDRLQKRVADLIVKVPYKAEIDRDPINIAIVVEHKAQSAPADNQRTIGNLTLYVVMETLSGLDAKPRLPKVPQALALLIYNGDDPNFDTPEWGKEFYLPDELGEFSLVLKIPCINLAKLFKEGKIVGIPLLQVSLTAMAAAGLRTLKSILGTLLTPLNQLTHWDDQTEELVNGIIYYVVEAASNVGDPLDRADCDSLVANVQNPKVRNTMKTIFDEVEERSKQEGLQEGLQRGEQQGELKGELKGKRDFVRQGLAFRYPNHPAELDANVGKIARIDQLDSLLKLVCFETRPLEEIMRCVSNFLNPTQGGNAPRFA